MTDILKSQLSYTPVVIGAVPQTSAIVCGAMGGSALPAFALSHLGLSRRIIVHRDYDLPQHAPADALYVAVSYSGNTEETLSFFAAAQAQGYQTAVIAAGGTLLARAKELGVPHIVVPEGMQPRDAFPSLMKAFLALMGETRLSEELTAYETEGEDVSQLASALTNFIPVVYASTHNEALAYILKIVLNETGKIPAFSNVFPEVNHNEMQGFDALGATTSLTQACSFVVLRDQNDHSGIKKRMDVFAELMHERGLQIHDVSLPALPPIQTLIWTWLFARNLGHAVAERRGVPADETPLIQDFKKRL